MVTMQIDILTLFPDTIRAGLGESILGRAQKNDIIRIVPHQIRDYTQNKQKQVDDAPYGGGQGMIMQAQPLCDCWRDVCAQAGERVHTIFMSPAGKPFTQAEANRLVYTIETKTEKDTNALETVRTLFASKTKDFIISLAVGGLFYAVALAFFKHQVFFFPEHQLKKRLKPNG